MPRHHLTDRLQMHGDPYISIAFTSSLHTIVIRQSARKGIMAAKGTVSGGSDAAAGPVANKPVQQGARAFTRCLCRAHRQRNACNFVGVAEPKVGGKCSGSAKPPITRSKDIICFSTCRIQAEAGTRAMCQSCEWAQPRHRAPGRPWRTHMWQC